MRTVPLRRGRSAASLVAYAAAALIAGTSLIAIIQVAVRPGPGHDDPYAGGVKVTARGGEAGLHDLAVEDREKAKEALARGDWKAALTRLASARRWYEAIDDEPATRELRARAEALRAEAGAE